MRPIVVLLVTIALMAGCRGSELQSNDLEWRQHGQNAAETRFSPLSQISRENVNTLGLDWYFDFDTRRGQEATPIVVDGVIYVSSAWSKVHAIDARTGQLLWQYDPEVPGHWAAKGCCDVVNRGVAYHEGRVFVGSFDGRLIALDSQSGEEVWEVDTLIDRSLPYTITGAPRIVKGRVLIGNGGGEFGVRGYVSAYDVNTGELDWRFYTVPGNPEASFENPILKEAAKTWTGEWWTYGGGGTVWDSMAYDEELDLLYIGVGNGSPWNPAIRSPEGGDNLFLSSILALRPETGEYVWHYQTTPGDQWDFTATQHMILTDLEVGGVLRKVIMQAPKNGFFYVLDRETGDLISAEPFVPVNWADGVNSETGRPNINPKALYHKTGEVFRSTPGPMGAHNWHPMSYNPQTGLVYIPAQELAFPYVAAENWQHSKLTVNMGLDLVKATLPDDPRVREHVKASLKGRLLAWDPVAQKEVWRVDHGGPWNGGTLSTAGGLVFQGDRAGGFSAYDANDGTSLWRVDAQTGIVAPPISYELDGEQYIAVVAGWGGILPLLLGELAHLDDGPQVNRSRLLVYKLGGQAVLPEPYDVIRAEAEPPARFGTDEQVQSGLKTYARYCAGCHGDSAVSGGVLPDLRKSFALSEPDTWKMIVGEGALEGLGMIGFGDELDEGRLEAIRAYVTHRAHESENNQNEVKSMLASEAVQEALLKASEFAELNAFITINEEHALARAEEVDKHPENYPLRGLVFAVKDNIHVGGLPSTAGTRGLENFVPEDSAEVVAQLEARGAIVLGTANMHELAFGITSDNAAFGAVGNPVDPKYIPGGSSGGSAVAVAAGIVPVALGSDTGGSMRIPASLTGIVGFRPSMGRYSQDGLAMISPIRDTIGPMAKTVSQIIEVDAVIAPHSSSIVPAELNTVRLAVPRAHFYEELDPEVARIMKEKLEALKANGVTLVEVDIPGVPELAEKASRSIVMSETRRTLPDYLAENYPSLTVSELIEAIESPDVKRMVEFAFSGELSDDDYQAALNQGRRVLRKAYADYFEETDVDAIVFPTTVIPASKREGISEGFMVNGELRGAFQTYVRNTDPGSLAGLPGISLPAGNTVQGLPVGLALDAADGADERLLSVALAVEVLLLEEKQASH